MRMVFEAQVLQGGLTHIVNTWLCWNTISKLAWHGSLMGFQNCSGLKAAPLGVRLFSAAFL